MPVVVRSVKPEEVLIDAVTDEYVDESVIVYIGTSNAEGGPDVCGISECFLGDVGEGSILVVAEESVFDDVGELRVVSGGAVV